MGRTSKRQKPPFARNIISRRKALGWNAHELARQADIPYPTLRDIEAGINVGRDKTKKAISGALGVSVSELYEDKGELSIPDFFEIGAFLSKLGSLSPSRQKAVLGIVHDDADYLADDPQLAPKFEALLEIL